MSVFRKGLFDGRNAIVTGGGSGIGKAIARELLGLGCKVVIASRKSDRLRETAAELGYPNDALLTKSCNIRKEEEVKELFDFAISNLGRIDFLVNNAGGQFPSPAAAISPKGWRAVVDTNLNGTFLCCNAALEASMGEQGGAIVNIIADYFNGFPGMAHTGAARAGVDNLTKTLALEWAPCGVRVNAVAPGVIWSQSASSHYKKGGNAGVLEKAIPGIPARRLGTVEEVSAAVTFLLSPAAAYITGATLKVDGAASLGKRDFIFEAGDYDPMPEYPSNDVHLRSKI